LNYLGQIPRYKNWQWFLYKVLQVIDERFVSRLPFAFFYPHFPPLTCLESHPQVKIFGFSAPTHATYAVQHRSGFVANVYSQAKKLTPQRISHVCVKQDQLPSHLTFAETVS